MGKLLDALKKKQIDLNKTGQYRDMYKQEQVKPLLIKLFNKLPEEKRYELLNEFLSPDAKERRTEAGFVSMLHRIKDQGKDASRKFLADNNSFGRPWQELLKPMEKRLGDWTETHYREEGIHEDSPAEDKLNTLFRSVSFANRMDFMWQLMDEKRKPAYQRQFLTETTADPELCSRYFSTQGTFAEGKDWGKFAEALDAALDEASLDEAEKSISDIKNPEYKKEIETLRGAVDGQWSDDMDKLRFLMQNAMLTPEDDLDVYDLKNKVDSIEWEKKLRPLKKTGKLIKKGELDLSGVIGRSKRIINDAENKKDIDICKEAALQNYRDIEQLLPREQQNSKEFKEMKLHAASLQEDVVKAKYEENAKNIDNGRDLISSQIETLEKEKAGFMLSKTNTPEHNRMTKNLRLFNAKLDMILGKKASQELSATELETVNNTDIKDLFIKAKRSTFDYSCIKSKYGKGRILHRDGIARNSSARNAFDLLNQIGSRLGLTDEATEMMDKVALDVLKFRGNAEWEKKNAEDCAAKTIYALSLIHGGVPDGRQNKMLDDESIDKHVEEIKKRPEFRQMVKNLGPTRLCETILKGGDELAQAYADAEKRVGDPQAGKSKAPVKLTAQQKRELWASETEQSEVSQNKPVIQI